MRKRHLWLVLLTLVLTACADTTPAATTDAPTGAEAPDLSGISFEVHKAPG